MPAGKYRHKITIQQPGTIRNEYGEIVEGYIDFLETRAQFKPLYGRQLFAAEGSGSESTVTFAIRYRTGIKANFRIRYQGEIYEILYDPMDVDGLHKELLIYCKKVE
jgi:SPP1 family predicted phage head-tail adaptor